MANNIVEITDEVKEKLRDFDEQEAYFLLCEIFSYAQATKNYSKFQSDLSEWKKRFPIDLFSEEFRSKIKYMLSKEFLDKILANFIAFDELSKKDPAVGLAKLRKILTNAEKHKNEKQLDKDLDVLYSEYPIKYLKEKYPHIVSQLLSKAYRTRILQKFESALAFKQLSTIIEDYSNYKNAEEFTDAIKEWKKLYPTTDFNNDYQTKVEQTLANTLSLQNLTTLFPPVLDLTGTQGQIIPIEFKNSIKNISLINKEALSDFFKIANRNIGDTNSIFEWVCKYGKYLNTFDIDTKKAIVSNLMVRYSHELPTVSNNYHIPKMDSNPDEYLSLNEYSSIEQTKKDSVIQILGLLSTEQEVSHEDIYRLSIIHNNSEKANVIKKAKIDSTLNSFAEKISKDELTPSDILYLNPVSNSGGGEVSVIIEEPIEIQHDEEIIEENTNTETTDLDAIPEVIEEAPNEKITDTESTRDVVEKTPNKKDTDTEFTQEIVEEAPNEKNTDTEFTQEVIEKKPNEKTIIERDDLL